MNPLLSGLQVNPNLPDNQAVATVAEPASGPAGAVVGGLQAPGVAVTGQLAASWQSAGTGGLQATAINAASATVIDATGKTVGTGAVALSSPTPVPVSVNGSVGYSVGGQGSLSFYGAGGDQPGRRAATGRTTRRPSRATSRSH